MGVGRYRVGRDRLVQAKDASPKDRASAVSPFALSLKSKNQKKHPKTPSDLHTHYEKRRPEAKLK